MPRVPNIKSTIEGRIPPLYNLREKALSLYDRTRAGCYKWYDGPVLGTASESALCWMALEGHARYYAATELLSEGFITSRASSGQKRAAYKYIMNWIPKYWPDNWPSTHTADILPTFLHKDLPVSDLVVSQTFTDGLLFFAAGQEDRMQWRKFEVDNRFFNVISRKGCLELITEGSGEFGLDERCRNLWKDVINASNQLGREAWIGMSR